MGQMAAVAEVDFVAAAACCAPQNEHQHQVQEIEVVWWFDAPFID
jgi:hypothetical protein